MLNTPELHSPRSVKWILILVKKIVFVLSHQIMEYLSWFSESFSEAWTRAVICRRHNCSIETDCCMQRWIIMASLMHCRHILASTDLQYLWIHVVGIIKCDSSHIIFAYWGPSTYTWIDLNMQIWLFSSDKKKHECILFLLQCLLWSSVISLSNRLCFYTLRKFWLQTLFPC